MIQTHEKASTVNEAAIMDRQRGALIGGLVGDALGAPYEFQERDAYVVSGEMEPVEHFKLPAGSFTDDGSMMLCLAQSLIEKNGHDPHDQIERYCKWLTEGYMSVNGTCFDCGRAVSTALRSYLYEKSRLPEGTQAVTALNPYRGIDNPNGKGNGGIMRICPVAIYFSHEPSKALDVAVKSSLVTHGSRECLHAAHLMTWILLCGFHGHEKTQVLKAFCLPESLGPAGDLERIYKGSFKELDRSQVKTSGYVVDTLEAALWALWHHDTFESGMLALLPLGDDVDTVCCVYGQLAGSFYGVQAIPEKWTGALQKRDLIEQVMMALQRQSE